ncbi:alpha/beta hydrolase family protein [Wenzhouxiangella marina]|uniref:alpha/beta hydrolase family protein n=1 Tax=Wenzhouxiangella marina TaxID=1579979 RepID=UPI0006734AF9|nr:alpha/beta fold hydrolase [Wenzhouxiangella marina]MBB6086881.1 putative alpha/beta hydrolase [Wenzhouxiangella marina]
MPHSQPTVSVVTDDGHHFDLIHVPSESARQALFFLPGMGLSARQYIPLGQSLAEHGIEVFIHEWRGIGSSDQRASRECNWGYRELLDVDLRAAIELLAERRSGRPMLLAGHSLGSQFACLLAGRRPDRTAGVITVAGGAPWRGAFHWYQQLLLAPAFRVMPVIGSLIGHYPGRRLGFAGREARGVIADWTWTGRRGSYALPSLEPDPEIGMAELKTRVLGIRLADDWFVPKASLDHLLGLMPGCEVERCMISALPGDLPTDHFAWMKAPAPVAEAISAHYPASSSTAASRRA